MAVDWIKVRIDLQSHPKVVRILSAMRPHDVQTVTDKFRVIGGLHAVWSVFDTHSEDGVLHGYTPEALDHVIGWEGFSAAMISVGWLAESEGPSLIMPEFQEHNGKSAKRRAEDQKRKRESRICPQSVRNLSEDSADKKRTREEKNIKPPISPKGESFDAAQIELPPAVNHNAWAEWVEYRNSRRKKISAVSAKKSIGLLAGFDHFTQQRMVDEAIRNDWQGLFAPKGPVVPLNSDRRGLVM